MPPCQATHSTHRFSTIHLAICICTLTHESQHSFIHSLAHSIMKFGYLLMTIHSFVHSFMDTAPFIRIESSCLLAAAASRLICPLECCAANLPRLSLLVACRSTCCSCELLHYGPRNHPLRSAQAAWPWCSVSRRPPSKAHLQ